MAVLLALGACGGSSTSQPKLSKSCQTERLAAVRWSNATVESLNFSRAAMRHWDKLWNRYVANPMTAEQFNAAKKKADVDLAASIAADKRVRTLADRFFSVRKACNTIPKGCATEFNVVYHAAIAHETREQAAVGKAFATETAQLNALNAQRTGQGSTAAVDAATGAHNVAHRRLVAVIREHNRLRKQWDTAQAACDKAIQ